jgi:RNase adaptor protein for sRNA GlmZ degradation
VTIKPITDKETEENGILKNIPDAPFYTVDTLPENVVKAMQKANKMDEVTLVCTVTRAHHQGEEDNFFIRDEKMKTLKVQLIQDQSGEV